MATITTVEKAADLIKDGMTIMVGGFTLTGSPEAILHEMAQRDLRDLTVICHDSGVDHPELSGMAKLINQGKVKKLIATYIRHNRESGRLMQSGALEVELVPQGTFVERIRAGGAGLGGVLTPTGVGTAVAEGKQVLTLNGRRYLLEMPLWADVAIIKATRADKAGNLFYHGTTRNFNVAMATAADLVIAQVEEVVEVGEIDPDHVVTPGIFVDYVVKA